ncbi:hypothetical protein [Burkholderia gladioli]|uniref:hypothetical protein n=1 Tax=Burkholderia gladioli TaxID=28095 RepID=UPI00163FAC7D|nr:hypothetical protein [Burkholderia gladioli]
MTELTPMQRFEAEGTHLMNNDYEAFGYWRGYEISANRENDGAWYIQVRHPDGCFIYDGWWTPDHEATVDDAVAEAFRGAELLEGQ